MMHTGSKPNIQRTQNLKSCQRNKLIQKLKAAKHKGFESKQFSEYKSRVIKHHIQKYKPVIQMHEIFSWLA